MVVLFRKQGVLGKGNDMLIKNRNKPFLKQCFHRLQVKTSVHENSTKHALHNVGQDLGDIERLPQYSPIAFPSSFNLSTAFLESWIAPTGRQSSG